MSTNLSKKRKPKVQVEKATLENSKEVSKFFRKYINVSGFKFDHQPEWYMFKKMNLIIEKDHSGHIISALAFDLTGEIYAIATRFESRKLNFAKRMVNLCTVFLQNENKKLCFLNTGSAFNCYDFWEKCGFRTKHPSSMPNILFTKIL